MPIKDASKEVLESRADGVLPIVEDTSMEMIHAVLADDATVKAGWETQVGRFDAMTEVEPTSEIMDSFNPDQDHLDHSPFTLILKQYMLPSGDMNYTELVKDASFSTYLKMLSDNPPRSDWPKNERMVYWINAYNAFTLKLIIDNLPVKSIKDIGSPWKKDFIRIDGEAYDLNTIEHEILRKQFDDPRIHFAINCASVSCPVLQPLAFETNSLEKELEKAARQFINDPSKNRIGKDKLELSKIFDWFKGDFAKNDAELINYVNRYADVQADPGAKISYLEYDWALNGR